MTSEDGRLGPQFNLTLTVPLNTDAGFRMRVTGRKISSVTINERSNLIISLPSTAAWSYVFCEITLPDFSTISPSSVVLSIELGSARSRKNISFTVTAESLAEISYTISLTVQDGPDYSAPNIVFVHPPPYYRIGSAFTLQLKVDDFTAVTVEDYAALRYIWTMQIAAIGTAGTFIHHQTTVCDRYD